MRGLEQKELATKIGISAMGLSYIEHGKNKPTKWINKISKVLECTPGQLMGFSNSMNALFIGFGGCWNFLFASFSHSFRFFNFTLNYSKNNKN